MPLLEVRKSCRLVPLNNVILDDVAMLGECCPPGRDSSLNLLVLVFVIFRHHLCLRLVHLHTLISTFFQLIPVAFVLVDVVY